MAPQNIVGANHLRGKDQENQASLRPLRVLVNGTGVVETGRLSRILAGTIGMI